jgi:Ni,Fe-hydrogenase I large subunit
MTLADGSGLAWVDNARGLLIHQVRLAGDRVQQYRIVAPTEWNFHPTGALHRALQGAPVADAAAAQQLAERLVHSLDPCVACRVELDGAG